MEHMQLGRVLMFALAQAMVAAVAADQTLSAAPPALNQTLPGCNYTCGDVEIPYPFGIGNSSTPDQRPCFLEEKFSLACNNSILISGNVSVLNISVPAHQMDVLFYVSRFCNDTNDNIPWIISTFSISRKENKLLTVGCNSFGFLNSYYDDKTYSTGCLTRCYGNELNIDDDGTCSGIGCCQVDIPPRMRNISIEASTFPNSTQWGNCSYSFVVKQDSYNFSRSHIKPATSVAEQAIATTRTVIMVTDAYVNDGYQGNPYLGCTVIDECMTGNHTCISNKNCRNTIGNYTCFCHKWQYGNGRKEGGCHIRTTVVIGRLSFFVVEEEEGATEFVPLEGEEEGEGNLFGNICSQYSFGNLDPSDRTTKARRVKSKHWYLQEPVMMMSSVTLTQQVHRALPFGFQNISFRELLVADMFSNVGSLPTCLFGKGCVNGRQSSSGTQDRLDFSKSCGQKLPGGQVEISPPLRSRKS
ncbi:Wall-associated receptor kinase 2 [Spatholobus suberectus]|nr:Wall-associated receptor kinase 2 [Spatholobus suberectus]